MDSAYNPFPDLPPINYDGAHANGLQPPTWSSSDFDFAPPSTCQLRYPSVKSHAGSGEGGDQLPMDRYMNGSDAVPYVADVIPFPTAYHDAFFSKHQDPTWPTALLQLSDRSGSPDSSTSSSGPTWSAVCPGEDYPQAYAAAAATAAAVTPPFGGDAGFHSPWFGCSGFGALSANSPAVSPTAVISLPQIQAFAEEDNIEPDKDRSSIDPDLDGDFEYDYEEIVVQTPADSETPQRQEDCLENNSALSDHDEDPEDPEFQPSRAAGGPRRASGRRSSTGTRNRRPTRPGNSASGNSGVAVPYHARGSNMSNAAGVSKKKAKPKMHASSSNRATTRPFPCPLAPFGCTSTFASKNEWKRHVSTQHVKLGFWRCDLCPSSMDPVNPLYNDFNRKDLFTQHLRRMHPCATDATGRDETSAPQSPVEQPPPLSDEVILAHQERCFKVLRAAPTESGCLFCEARFEGQGSWDDRMEHVGSHLERWRRAGQKVPVPSQWVEDETLREWLVVEGLVEMDGKGVWRIGDGRPRRPEVEVVENRIGNPAVFGQ